nr:uncharacterized protein K02A2.6-like [Onthophagus taurus]
MIRDKLVTSIFDKNVQQRLLGESDISLEKIQGYCKSIELGKYHAQVLNPLKEINQVKKKCNYCGLQHEPRKCPAYGKTCANCQGRNHFAKVCKKDKRTQEQEERKGTPKEQKKEKINEVQEDNNEEEISIINTEIEEKEDVELFIYSVTCKKKNCWYENLKILNNEIKFKLDTGADVSVLPLHIFNSLNVKKQLDLTPITLVAFGNNKLKPVGKIDLSCGYKNVSKIISFVVVNIKTEPLLGLSDCLKFNLLGRINTLNKIDEQTEMPKNKTELLEGYQDLFDSLGEITGTCKIELTNSAIPTIQAKRKIPLSLRPKLKETLENLEKKEIISKVDQPTDWVNSLMIVEKPNGQLRLCLDPKPLNKFIKRQHFMIPTSEDIFTRLAEKNVFTVMDMKEGFWQLKLDEKSSELCTFNTPFGRYKFNRLPFGISSAPEIFQATNFEIFGKTEKEHDLALRKVFERTMIYNVTFNSNKFPYNSQSNGLAEKAAGIAKKMLKKCKNYSDFIIALTEYRNSPLPQLGCSAIVK